MEQIFALIGKAILFAGGSAGIAFLVFRFLGVKWIENKFARSLEALKHAQAQELEHAKLQLNLLFNRATKLHDKEFDILPNVWGKLNDAQSSILRIMFRFRQHPDFDRMSEEELENYLKDSSFSEPQKKMMRESRAKNQTYGKISTWREMNEAHEAFVSFHEFLTKNRVFLSKELKGKFDQIDTLMWEMWVANKVGQDSGDGMMAIKKFEECDKPIKDLMQQIEAMVQKRLRPEDNRPEENREN